MVDVTVIDPDDEYKYTLSLIKNNVIDLKYRMSKRMDCDILQIVLIRNEIKLKNFDKIVHDDNISSSSTVETDEDPFTFSDFEYLEKIYKFKYPVRSYSFEMQTVYPDQLYEAFKIVSPFLVTLPLDSSVTYRTFERMVTDHLCEMKMVNKKSLAEICSLSKKIYKYDGVWKVYQTRYRSKDENIPLINFLKCNHMFLIKIFIRIDGFIRVNYGYGLEKSIAYIKTSMRISDLIDRIPELKFYAGRDRERIVVYKDNNVLMTSDSLVSNYLTEDSSVTYALLPLITIGESFDIKILRQKKESLFDLTITLVGGDDEWSFKVLATLFLMNGEVGDENIFVLWFKNRGKFFDIKTSEMKINVGESPFDRWTFLENKFALGFVIDYLYRDISAYNYKEIVNHLICIQRWCDYFGLGILQELFKHKDIVNYYAKIENVCL
ncbi:MAG: hypothetical protein Harvfovirus3_44 [Harvfovirus sp.]|uniref:Uncharacterized protein n=1 Tax=Harvfovirus sp. TaxID=2487768 RepID=A0A3G5A535_9VIRU|nr:MAG: hypothetical protein Harvfovirus3_44 [Harvfovirus sp.]